VRFEDAPAATVPGSLEALEAARDLASLPSSVTAAAALDLLRSPDDGAFRDALEALASVQADAAAGVARRTALPAPGERIPPAARRVIAVKTLRALGGAAVFPGEFRKLAGDPDPLVAEAAK
jgi:hypothetical protein